MCQGYRGKALSAGAIFEGAPKLRDQDKYYLKAILKNQNSYFKHQNWFMMNKTPRFHIKTGLITVVCGVIV